MTKKRTENEIKKAVRQVGYIYIDNYYTDENHRRVVLQDQNGYKYDSYLNDLLKGITPKIVSVNNPFTLSHNIPLWLKLNNSQFELLEDNEYNGTHLKLNFYCRVCKDYPKMTWTNLSRGSGCGVCDGNQVGVYHNLAIQRPSIAAEWHPTKNRDLTPKDVTYGSGIKAWWLCPNGHNYFSSINQRTSGNGCKICSDSQKESKIASELKQYILNKYQAKEEYSILKNPETNRPLPFDIYIFGGKNPELNGVYIEVHWLQHYKITQWHKGLAKRNGTSSEEEFESQKNRDRLKRKFACKYGTYIEIDLRKIKETEKAIEYIESILETLK